VIATVAKWKSTKRDRLFIVGLLLVRAFTVLPNLSGLSVLRCLRAETVDPEFGRINWLSCHHDEDDKETGTEVSRRVVGLPLLGVASSVDFTFLINFTVLRKDNFSPGLVPLNAG